MVLYKKDQQKLSDYNLRDCQLAYEILEKTKAIELSVERSELTGLPLDKVTGSIVDLPGYELQIMGGSDIAGFPMRQDLNMNTRKKLLVRKGDVGIRKAIRGTIYRKTVSGNTVSDITAQLNLKVIQHGSKSIEDLWGIKKEEKPVEAAPAPAKQ